MKRLLIAGAGGHGRVVADAALACGIWECVHFLDDRFPTLEAVDRMPVVGVFRSAEKLSKDYHSIIVALGDNSARIRWLTQFERIGFRLPILRHPSAVVSPGAKVGAGTVVLANATINTGAQLGIGCIVNSGSIVEHDCRLGDGVHVSPGACLTGGVVVGDRTWIGAGATIMQGVEVGRDVIVGVSAAVIGSVAENCTVVGIPAMPKTKKELRNEEQ